MKFSKLSKFSILKTASLACTLALISAFLAVPAPALAQSATNPTLYSTGNAIGAVSTDVAMLVKFVGTAASGKVAVAAGGALTFTEGASGAEAATATFECPVSGALGGVIDVTNAACDTLGEVCDVINGTTGSTETGWACVLLDGARADSSNDTIATISATQAKVAGGLALYHDDTVDFFTSTAMLTPAQRKIEWYINERAGGKTFKPMSLIFPTTFLSGLCLDNATTTYSSGTSALTVYAHNYDAGGASKWGMAPATVRTLYATPGGATTANKDFTGLNAGCLWGGPGEKLVSRIVNSAVMSAAVHYSWGKLIPTTAFK